MPSSPAEAALSRIATLYDEADAALRAGDLDGVGARIDAVEPLLERVRAERPDRAALAGAQQSHRRLIAELTALRDQTAHAIAEQRRGLRLLAAYGRRYAVTGARVEHDG